VPATTANVPAELPSLRVCLISFTGYPDQGATYFFEMARSLARLGHQVTAFAVQREGEPRESVEDAVRVVRESMALTMNWASPARWMRKARFLHAASRYVASHDFDVVHVYCTIGAFALPLAGRHRAKWVQEHQTGAVSSQSRLARRAEDRLRAWQGKLFDANLTVSKILGERLFGSAGRFDVVPAGVSLSVFGRSHSRDLRSELGIPDDAIVFVHAGVLEATRATDIPLRALAKALETDARLWLLMPGKGAQLDELRQLARDLNIQSRVWLPGYLPYQHLPRVFAAAEAGLSYLPDADYYEGQPPMKVMEYMGAGLPVIASDVSGHRMLIVHEKNGLLSLPNADSYAAAMLRFAGDAHLREQLASAAKPSVAHLTYDQVARERLIPIYQRLLSH
jgi:glycosyltransferase involved in cell wall biosynthesis